MALDRRITMYHNASMQHGTGSIARIAGLDLHWAEIGEGPPIVLLHGLTDSHRTWGKIAPTLARTRRVLMPDLAGHGLSSRPDASYSLEWHAEVIGQWLDALGLDQIDLVGHSFGGGVAQWILLTRRARIRRLGLVAAGGLGREVSTALRLAALPLVVEHFGQPFMRSGTRIALRAVGGCYDATEIEELAWLNSRAGSARALARTVRDVIGWNGQYRHFLYRAHEIGGLPPTALYWGDRDRVIPLRHATDTTEYLDHVTVTRFADCGHFPHRERPQEFAHALESFIDQASCESAVMRLGTLRRGARPSLWRRAWQRVTGIFRRRRSRAFLEAPRAVAVVTDSTGIAAASAPAPEGAP